MVDKIRKHIGIIIFLFVYILIALFTYKSYGITADEKAAYDGGQNLSDYLSKDSTFETLHYYATESSLEVRSNPLQYSHYRFIDMLYYKLNPNEYFEWYHLFNILTASLIFVAIYMFLYKSFQNQNWSLLGPLFLFLTPGFSGHIPANPKDIPFSIFYFLGLTAIYLTPKSNKYIQVLLLGMIIGVTQSIRVIGFTLFLIYFAYNLYILAKDKKLNTRNILNLISSTIIIFIISNFLMVITWPYIGLNYFSNLLYYIKNSTDFQQWNNTMFYMSNFLTKYQRPWHYLFIWLLISTPLTTLGFFILALIRANRLFKDEGFMIIFVTFISIMILYLITKPVIYNGMRHFLFIVPMIICISVYSLKYLIQSINNIRLKVWFLCMVFLYSAFTLFRMTSLYPYEYIYFNEAVGGLKGVQKSFEKDYWGATYKEASQWVGNFVTDNHLKNIMVYPCNLADSVSYYSNQNFIIAQHAADADIIICDYDNNTLNNYQQPIIHTISREGAILSYIRANNPKLINK